MPSGNLRIEQGLSSAQKIILGDGTPASRPPEVRIIIIVSPSRDTTSMYLIDSSPRNPNLSPLSPLVTKYIFVCILDIILVKHCIEKLTSNLTQNIRYTVLSSFLQVIHKLKFTGTFSMSNVGFRYKTGCRTIIKKLYDSLMTHSINHIVVLGLFFRCFDKAFCEHF